MEISGSYTITYDANGGTNAPQSQLKNYGEAITLSDKVPTRDGYTFCGWSSTVNGEVEYKPGSTYASDDNACILCNEEGKLIGLEPNRRLGKDILISKLKIEE